MQRRSMGWITFIVGVLWVIPAFGQLGTPTVAKPKSIQVARSETEISQLVSCPPARKMEDMQECNKRRAAVARKDIQPADGKTFVLLTFDKAPKNQPIAYNSREFSLVLADGASLPPYAVRTQGTKYEGDKRVAWPEANKLQLEIWMATYTPLEGEPPFTVVFEAPASQKKGTLTTKGAKIPLVW